MKAVVLHSGGMDSSLCLVLACRRYGAENVTSLGFHYDQRHVDELIAAREIAAHFGVYRKEIEIVPLPGWNASSLVNKRLPISCEGKIPNSFVPGRNGVFLMIAASYAYSIGAKRMSIGVMEQEGANSGYPDCSRDYVDSVQKVIQQDYQDEGFCIETPLVHMSKVETLELAETLGELIYLMGHTISCYEGISQHGCGSCPACQLKKKAFIEFAHKHPGASL